MKEFPSLLGGDIREFSIDTTVCNRCSEETSNGLLKKSRLAAGDVGGLRVGYPRRRGGGPSSSKVQTAHR